jgi:transcriptional repressor of dcmA and dcmR
VPIDAGSHLALVYANDGGRTRWSAPFLSDGLEAGDPCLLLAPSEVQWAVLNTLATRGHDVEAAIDAGRLGVLAGEANADAVLAQIEGALRGAAEQGHGLVRFIGDLAWCFDAGLTPNDLAAFELRYEMHLAHRHPVISLCQYDARRFTGEALLEAMKCHRDTFRQPPELFLA